MGAVCDGAAKHGAPILPQPAQFRRPLHNSTGISVRPTTGISVPPANKSEIAPRGFKGFKGFFQVVRARSAAEAIPRERASPIAIPGAGRKNPLNPLNPPGLNEFNNLALLKPPGAKTQTP